MDALRSVRQWIGNNIVGGDYGDGEERTRRDYAVMGAATGALAGAAIGTVTGFAAQSEDSIREEWVTRTATHPELRGYHYSVWTDYSTECHTEGYGEDAREVCHTEIDGWWHNYRPNIHNRPVGTYTEPTFSHTRSWEPLLGGFVGAVAGGVVGLGIGLGVAVLKGAVIEKPVEKPRLSDEKRMRLVDFAGNSALVGTVAGAGIGAWLGAEAGRAELGNQEVHTRNWMVPVTQSQHLGDIPRDWYEWNWSGWGWPSNGRNDWSHGSEAVYRQVPLYNADGSVRMEETSETFTTNRYGPIAGGIIGGVVGAGVGLAAGVAVGVGAKLLAEHQAAQEQKEPAA